MTIVEIVSASAGIWEEHVRDDREQQRPHADEQELAEEAEIPFRRGRDRTHGEEDHAGAGRGVADQAACRSPSAARS